MLTLRQTILYYVFALLIGVLPITAHAAGFDVENIQVEVKAVDAVKARDQAIITAQRKAFAVLVGRSEDQIQSVSDGDIERLVGNFSVRGERLTARSYSAVFTVRFDPNRTQMFIQSRHFDLIEQPVTGAAIDASAAPVVQTQKIPETILVLPVLDIGSRRVVWDEPNPWRDVWQKTNHSMNGLTVKVPLGDVSDIADIPDARFLNGEPVQLDSILTRYMAEALYIVVAKNQGAALDPSGGMALYLYRHDGQKLNFIKKTVVKPRPGYLFDDAVPAALQLIVMTQNNQAMDDDNDVPTTPATEDVETTTTLQSMTNVPAGLPSMVTIPYQSLPQWVNIQRRLRQIPGVRDIVPIRVSPSSAQVQIISSVDATSLAQNMARQGFTLQAMPNGEWAITEQ